MTQATDELVVRVTVTRTGGFAGLKREWSAEPSDDDAPRWVALIEGCPWDDAPDDGSPPLGADLFVWRIRARFVESDEPVERDAELQDPQVTGPWQALIDEVRSASATEAPDVPA